jgi:hypothetical protein
MQWAWATSLDELWRSPSFPMWVTLIAAGFSALVVLIVLLRADKTMANGALAVIALLAIGIASTSAVRSFGPPSRVADAAVEPRSVTQHVALAPALACLDGLAGESVESACEKAVFGSADTTAAAVSYVAGQVSRVIATGSARTLTPEQQILRRAVERDRYGLVAQVITTRDRCVVDDCPLFRALSDANQIKANMNERLYDTLVTRYSSSWTSTAAAAPSPAAGLLAGVPPASGLPPSANVPTGRPSTVDFATSAAIPPVSIMTADPPAQSPSAAAKSSNAQPQANPSSKSTNAQPQGTPNQSSKSTSASASAKSTNAQAQAKRASAPPAQTATGQPHQPSAAVGRPRVVAPVPYVPSQAADD